MACVFPASQGVVVGGGLAGVSAANTLLEHGQRVVIVDKSSFLGGNSTKATSGINGANTSTQRAQGIQDTVEIFNNDVMKGGAKKPDIVKVLCKDSGPGVEWLMEKFDLDLSLVARLGGHSNPRTHRGKERFPGMTITYALIQMVEKVAERSDRARILTKARACELLTTNGSVVGLVYEKAGQFFQEHGPVILATGGFGADFTQNSLLAKHRPDLMHLPTTNGEHCTGDGIKIAEAVGGRTIDLEWVQVHPTGLVKTDDPDAKVKFLAAEALRGVGGLVLDANGKRFCNELGRRDYVTGEMWKNKGPFRLVLNSLASKEIHWHCEHYKGRGVMKQFNSGADLAKEIGCSLQTLVDVHDEHYNNSKKQEKDPEGGPWPAYPSGKSWDEPSGKTGVGKKFFHNCIPGSAVASEVFHSAFITPVIHYCMGGLEITEKAEVLGQSGPIQGLYAAGEVSGGVHGNNRLGGNALLECVVFGRVAGRNAAQYMGNVVPTDLREISGGGLSAQEETKPAATAVAAAGAPAAAAPSGGGITLEEVAKHNTKEDCWVVVNDEVLDVTSFLPDHPGGELAILTFAGKDATAEFNMIHPPDVIGKYAPDAVIGRLGTGAPASGEAAAAGAEAPAVKAAAGNLFTDDFADDEDYSPGAWMSAIWYVVYAFVLEIFKTIFFVKNYNFHDRQGLTRSAIFLIMFIVIHALGNLHMFGGADHFNAYGYFYVRLYWTGFGLQANIVEEYVALSALLHVVVALSRTFKFKQIALLKTASGREQLTLIMTGLPLLAFMILHLQQFRFGETDPYMLRPQWMWPFFTDDKNTPLVAVRDIYKLEVELFQDGRWVLLYLAAVVVFGIHMWKGWTKIANSLIPLRRSQKFFGVLIGQCITVFICLMYMSFPIYSYYFGAATIKYAREHHAGAHVAL